MDNVLLRIRAFLGTTAARWHTLAAAIPPEVLEQEPLPGEWSPKACLGHLIDAEAIFRARVLSFLAGEDIRAFNPDREAAPLANRTPAELAFEFARLRGENLGLLAGLGAQDLDRGSTHNELGPVKLRELLHEWVAHDLAHTVQAERALMQPFIAGCGPWRIYFEDHVLPGPAEDEG